MRLNDIYFAGNVLRERFENPTSVKSFVLFGSIIVFFIIAAIAISTATSKRGEKKSQNTTAFYEDDVLETKKLERTLSVALIAVAVVAVSITGYYLWEPNRQAKMTQSFNERSVRRGQTLFANASMKGYSNVQSLGCANCHGGYNEETGRYAEGGNAPFTIKSIKDPETDPACAGDEKFRNPDCITTTVSWKAPSLNTALYKYPIRKADPTNPLISSCRLQDQHTTPDCRTQVYDILTYGRPGTPMPAWGVAGGGPKNEQAINDLVNFITAIQLPADEAAQPLRSAEIIKQNKVIKEAKVALKKTKEEALSTGSSPEEVDKAEGVIAARQTLSDANAVLTAIQAKDETAYMREAALKEAQANYDSAKYQMQETGDGSTLTASETLKKAQDEYNAAKNTYDSTEGLKQTSNPQEYLDSIDKAQTIIKLEAEVEKAKAKGKEAAIKTAQDNLVKANELKNLALNFVETRDALARAKAVKEIFAPASLENSRIRLEQVKSQSDGQLLFESNCARCHTKGWSFFNPSDSRVALPSAQGTGAFGPSLLDVKNQFVDAENQISFIGAGSAYQVAYGARGIGSGRMPGFNTAAGPLLDETQIAAIVEYERNGLFTATNSLGVTPLGSPLEANNNIAGNSATNNDSNTNSGSRSNSKTKTGTNSNEGAGTSDKTGN